MTLSETTSELRNAKGRFNAHFSDAGVAREIIAHVHDNLRKYNLLGEHVSMVEDVSVLRQLPGACEQDMHVDFPANVFNFGEASLPLSVLWAIVADFHLKVDFHLNPGVRYVHVPMRHMLVFRADLEHAGCAGRIQSSDWRIHVLVQSRRRRCPPNLSYTLRHDGDNVYT